MNMTTQDNKEYQKVSGRVAVLERKIDRLETLIETLSDKIDTSTVNTSDMVDAWKTAKGVSTFVKWFSTLALGCGAIWAVVHNNFTR